MKIVNKTGNPFDTKLLDDEGKPLSEEIMNSITSIKINIKGNDLNSATIEFSNVKLDLNIEDKNVKKIKV
jgi:hypothetical protein